MPRAIGKGLYRSTSATKGVRLPKVRRTLRPYGDAGSSGLDQQRITATEVSRDLFERLRCGAVGGDAPFFWDRPRIRLADFDRALAGAGV